jgi:cell volume regulation protein A
MESIGLINTYLLVGAALIIAGIFSSMVASRFGTPLLLVFLVVGMLVGEDGPGGIHFENYELAYLIGSLALAIILFDGGLRTRVASFRGALAPAATLATVGVVLTAALTGIVAYYVFPLRPLEALLIGSVVASTDAAAVFFLLRSAGIELRPRVGTTLEIESATNDPMALLLTVVIVQLVLSGAGHPTWEALGVLAQQAILGAVSGAVGGLLASWLVNRIALPSGLHPLFVATNAILIYAFTAYLGGSGFLAVYLAGLVLGNRPIRAYASISSFHDAATWMCQIVMFIMLGLLVTPSRLLDYALPALAIAVALIVVARPISVWLCLAPFRFSWRETTFVSWVGLRGAVSIFLSAIPILTGLPHADLYFNVAFFVVLVSLCVQGWSIRFAAGRLNLALPRRAARVARIELDLPGQLDYEMVGYPITPDSPVLDRGGVPRWARPVLVVRNSAILSPAEAGPPREGDYAYFLAPLDRIQRFDRLFAATGSAAERAALGEFPLGGDVTLSALAGLYNLEIDLQQHDTTIADLFTQQCGEGIEEGERVPLDAVTLVARKVEGGRVVQAGVQLDELTSPSPPWLAALRARGVAVLAAIRRLGFRRARARRIGTTAREE